MRTPRPLAVGAVTLVGLGLAACGDRDGASTGGPAATIAVTATDTECTVAKAEAAAGTVSFSITNSGSKINEFYVYGPGDRVMSEVENIGPGVTRNLRVELPAGAYQTACKPGMSGKGIRGAFTVTGSAKPLTDNAKLAQATDGYSRYVQSQTEALIQKTTEFVTAVKAGDAEKAKALYPVARTYWERIEPVADIFGDLDPKIDGREDAVEPGMQFTGFHRIEKDLWDTKDISRDGPVADQLLADVNEIVAKARSEKLSPLQLANGAKELLDEVATGKITGEEDRYSHTDLWDFAANLEGSKNAIAVLRPILDERAPDLVKTLDTTFAATESTLGRHARGDGWKLHNELSPAELKELSDSINALGEPVSRVAAIVSR